MRTILPVDFQTADRVSYHFFNTTLGNGIYWPRHTPESTRLFKSLCTTHSNLQWAWSTRPQGCLGYVGCCHRPSPLSTQPAPQWPFSRAPRMWKMVAQVQQWKGLLLSDCQDNLGVSTVRVNSTELQWKTETESLQLNLNVSLNQWIHLKVHRERFSYYETKQSSHFTRYFLLFQWQKMESQCVLHQEEQVQKEYENRLERM